MGNFITDNFWYICGGWGGCSLIVLIGAFVLNYLDFKEYGIVRLSVKDIFWIIVLILLGPITILIVIVSAILERIEHFIYSDFWKKDIISIEKKHKKK